MSLNKFLFLSFIVTITPIYQCIAGSTVSKLVYGDDQRTTTRPQPSVPENPGNRSPQRSSTSTVSSARTSPDEQLRHLSAQSSVSPNSASSSSSQSHSTQMQMGPVQDDAQKMGQVLDLRTFHFHGMKFYAPPSLDEFEVVDGTLFGGDEKLVSYKYYDMRSPEFLDVTSKLRELHFKLGNNSVNFAHYPFDACLSQIFDDLRTTAKLLDTKYPRNLPTENQKGGTEKAKTVEKSDPVDYTPEELKKDAPKTRASYEMIAEESIAALNKIIEEQGFRTHLANVKLQRSQTTFECRMRLDLVDPATREDFFMLLVIKPRLLETMKQ